MRMKGSMRRQGALRQAALAGQTGGGPSGLSQWRKARHIGLNRARLRGRTYPPLATARTNGLSDDIPIPPTNVEMIEVVLTCVRMAARDTNLYTFQRPDRGPLPGAEPGSHIGVILANGI